MDDLITAFVDTKYSPEAAALIYRALGIQTIFQRGGGILEVIDAINQSQNEHPEVIADQVSDLVEQHTGRLLQFVLGIEVNEDCTLTDKVMLCETMYAFTYLEDYQPFKSVLENPDTTDREKLINVFSAVNGESVANLESIVEDVHNRAIRDMASFVFDRVSEEDSAEDMALLKKVRRNIAIFHLAFGNPRLVSFLEDFELKPGENFSTYLELLASDLLGSSDTEAITFGLLWLALFSKDGADNPQKLLMDHAPEFFSNLEQLSEFNTMLAKALGRFEDFKGNLK
jgi:hypothetical protein